ncbi:MAG: cupin domain-containing protein [Nitrospirae bacterium]|nr:cupin domain-containing protein [Nitrospirota bacterium]
MLEEKKTSISCDWKAGPALKGRKASKENKSKLYRYKGNFRWHGIRIERYKPGGKDWSDIIRQTLIGNHGESAKFHLRYFEISPGGHSSLERHRHEHVVICVRGKGRVLTDKKTNTLNFLDTLYIAPDTPHQLSNPFDKPFGFLCIVNAKRDRPKILLQKSLSCLI